MAERPTILIVDDYQDALEVWELYLGNAGYTVLTASDGMAAVQRAMTALPDLIVLDLELPGLSGYQVAQAIREQPSTSAIPLIAATGYSQPRKLDEARDVGFDAVIVKPCDPDALLSEIRRLLHEAGPGLPAPNRHPDSTSG